MGGGEAYNTERITFLLIMQECINGTYVITIVSMNLRNVYALNVWEENSHIMYIDDSTY